MGIAAHHMRRALALAASVSEREVAPNPRVGAVVVAADGSTELASGAHERWGGPHAEAAAFAVARSRGVSLAGATLYVTLEPCSYRGEGKKTPPCVDAVIASGVARVVVAARDPNPLVDGRGLDRIRSAGIAVETGLLADEARALNPAFHLFHERRRPFVTAKWAMSLDGKIACASGASRWISCEASRAATHALRAEQDAIVVGIGTASRDDPALTVRHGASLAPGRAGVPPMRVVLDADARLDPASRLAATAREVPVVVFAALDAPDDRVARLSALGVDVVRVARASTSTSPESTSPSASPSRSDAADGIDLASALAVLASRGVQRVLVEGGSRLLGSLFSARLVDRVVAVVAPIFLGDGGAPAPVSGSFSVPLPDAAPRLARVRVERKDDDLLVSGDVVYRA